MPIHPDKEVKANRPDSIAKWKSKKLCILIDMAVPSERNIMANEVEKLSKYKDLELEIGRMWYTKIIVIPLVIGALGIICKGMIQYVEQLHGKIMIEKLQKIVLLGTTYIIRTLFTM